MKGNIKSDDMTMTSADSQPDQHAAADGTRFIDARRRSFLQGTAAAGAVAVAGGVQADDLAAVAAPEAPPVPVKSAGYRLTDHVRTYYDRARF